jgi:hypothetical protein
MQQHDQPGSTQQKRASQRKSQAQQLKSMNGKGAVLLA